MKHEMKTNLYYFIIKLSNNQAKLQLSSFHGGCILKIFVISDHENNVLQNF